MEAVLAGELIGIRGLDPKGATYPSMKTRLRWLSYRHMGSSELKRSVLWIHQDGYQRLTAAASTITHVLVFYSHIIAV